MKCKIFCKYNAKPPKPCQKGICKTLLNVYLPNLRKHAKKLLKYICFSKDPPEKPFRKPCQVFVKSLNFLNILLNSTVFALQLTGGNSNTSHRGNSLLLNAQYFTYSCFPEKDVSLAKTNTTGDARGTWSWKYSYTAPEFTSQKCTCFEVRTPPQIGSEPSSGSWPHLPKTNCCQELLTRSSYKK